MSLSLQQSWLLRYANTGDKMAGFPRLGNQIRTQVKLPGIAADIWWLMLRPTRGWMMFETGGQTDADEMREPPLC